ncbi:SDR family oxidoreductase [Sediminibacterium sp.]|uniref:SDR family oxidoreductase n=1 Tax=Sediminibacterium sp. TaxID=1917865 RepID=UPI0025D2048A|nr:SDR family oxidoreductase [Sediminibacterium sp.]MBW0177650.1 SDR family oxidoreductase [Sediminibacterium sp.]
MKPKIVLTGGSGLLAVNWAVTVRETYDVILLLHEREVAIAGVISVKVDIGSYEALINVLSNYQPDVVIHTAGLTSVEVCESNPTLANQVNVEISANIAIVTHQLGIKMVHISTDHLFDGTTSLLTEETIPSPLNMYGYTKGLAERKVLERCPHALVVRTNFYGWGTSYRKSFSDMIIFSLRQKKQITLYSDVYYSPIYVSVLISSIHALIDKGAAGIFNVVSDSRISKYEFGMLLANEFSLDTTFITEGALAPSNNVVKRPLDMSLSNIKATEFIGRQIGLVQDHIRLMKTQEYDSSTIEIQHL